MLGIENTRSEGMIDGREKKIKELLTEVYNKLDKMAKGFEEKEQRSLENCNAITSQMKMEEKIEKEMKEFLKDFSDFLARKGRKLKRRFPIYSGTNLVAWIKEMELCFSENGVPEEYKLSLAVDWLQIWREMRSCQSWLELKMELLKESLAGKMTWQPALEKSLGEEQVNNEVVAVLEVSKLDGGEDEQEVLNKNEVKSDASEEIKTEELIKEAAMVVDK